MRYSDDMSQPLHGLRVVIPRAEGRGNSLAARLRELGAEPVLYPVITYAAPEDLAPLQTAVQRLMQNEFDWLVLTSVRAVRAVRDRIAQSDPIPGSLSTKIAAVGPATAAACVSQLHQTPAAMPDVFTADALPTVMGELHGQRVLLLNADIAPPGLQQALQKAGAQVERVIAYRTIRAQDNAVDMPALLRTHAVHAILFTSGSTVRYFVERVGPALFDAVCKLTIVCIGPNTAAVVQALGLRPAAVATAATEDGLIKALMAAFNN